MSSFGGQDAANAKAAYYAKINNLKVSVADSKRRDAESRAVRAETLCFAAKRRAAASEAKLAEVLQVQQEAQALNLDEKLKAAKARELQDRLRAARREEQHVVDGDEHVVRGQPRGDRAEAERRAHEQVRPCDDQRGVGAAVALGQLGARRPA